MFDCKSATKLIKTKTKLKKNETFGHIIEQLLHRKVVGVTTYLSITSSYIRFAVTYF